MRIETLFRDEYTTVKNVYLHGEFFYRVVYIFDNDGNCELMTRTYKNGTIEIQ